MNSAVRRLSDIPLNEMHVVSAVSVPEHAQEWRQWLEEIGFIPGEQVMVTARGMLGGDPLVVHVGASTFALRLAEAGCVQVTAAPATGARQVA
ncbi:MAG: FeoA family protein [Betaproteobacteria bacterium]